MNPFSKGNHGTLTQRINKITQLFMRIRIQTLAENRIEADSPMSDEIDKAIPELQHIESVVQAIQTHRDDYQRTLKDVLHEIYFWQARIDQGGETMRPVDYEMMADRITELVRVNTIITPSDVRDEAYHELGWYRCFHCAEWKQDTDENWEGYDVCETCHEDLYTSCYECGEPYLTDDMSSIQGELCCQTCFDDYKCEYCEDCGEEVRLEDIVIFNGINYCEECAMIAEEEQAQEEEDE